MQHDDNGSTHEENKRSRQRQPDNDDDYDSGTQTRGADADWRSIPSRMQPAAATHTTAEDRRL
jgi:hypothetical protein